MSRTKVRVKRVYEDPSADDGQRILVDRIWPRGMSKEKAHLDQWLKRVAPSTELRKWYAHDPDKWDEFQERYREELTNNADQAEALEELKKLRDKGPLTLLTSSKAVAISDARLLADLLNA